MRKLVRISSANRYKIFVTSDKGWPINTLYDVINLLYGFRDFDSHFS